MKYARACIDCRNWYFAPSRLSVRCPHCAYVRRVESRRLTVEQKLYRALLEHDHRSVAQMRRRASERYIQQHGAQA